jgi:hypothetical protein
MSRPSLRGRFTWHELMTTDTKSAAAFYQKVVGWKTEGSVQIPYYTIWMGRQGPAAGLMTLPEEAKAMGAPPNWLTYIGTPDVEGTIRDTVRLGGRVVKEIMAVPGVGRFAVLADPQGAVFATLQPETPMPAKDQAELGEFSWHELVTTNWEAAFRFYQELFGWEKLDAMDMGPMGTYQIYGWPGLRLGGMYNKPAEMPAPPHWLLYALVKDSRTAAEVIARNGGKVLHGPAQIAEGGWITNAMDPQGAAFATYSTPVATAAARKPAPGKAKTTKKKTAKSAETAKSVTRAKPAKAAKRAKAAKPRKAKSRKKSR